jgi:hypothetical protein
MKRIIITVKDDHEVEIINQVLHEAEECDPALQFPFDFKVEDVDDVIHPYFEDGK